MAADTFVMMGADGQNRMLVADNRVANILCGGCDTEICRAFALNNRISGVAHFVVNRTTDNVVQFFANLTGEALDTGSARDGAGPDENFAVAVFADDVGVNGFGRDAEVASQNAAETRRIEHGTGSEYTVFGETGEFQRDFRHNVNRIGGDD